MSTVAAEHREGQPIYLYAIVPSGSDGQDALAGTDTSPGSLSTIAVGPYSAVVGSSPAPELKGRSREDLARMLIAHQRVLERFTRMAWVLPVKFGTRMPDEKGIYELLERGRSLFDSTFAELQGCTQLEISVTWDIDAEFADIASEVPVAQLKAQIADSVAGATAARRLALGRLVKQALDRRRAAVATHVSDALRAVAIDTIANPVAADRAVLHLVLLLKTDALGKVDRCLETLDAAYGGRLCFRCVGPMPAANFATLEIEVLEGGEVEHAGRVLGVAPTVSLDEVRSAFHRLARAAHPDAADRSDDSAGTMAALSDAYKVLARYARAREAYPQGGGSAVSDPDIAAPAVLVSIRRPDAESGVGRIATET